MKKAKSDNLENINKLKGIVENLDFAQLIQNKKLLDELIPAELWKDHSWFFMAKGEVSHSGYQQIEKYFAKEKNYCRCREAGTLKIKVNVYYSFFCKQKMDFKACIGEADLLQLKNSGTIIRGLGSVASTKKEGKLKGRTESVFTQSTTVF